MKLFIVTINYNGSESTIKLLKSLAEQTDKNFQTIVIDNASEETDFNNLKMTITRQDLFKQVLPGILIRNDQNLGFSGGNNVGIKEALRRSSERGQDGLDWVLLLNNDTWVESGFIASLKAKLSQSSGIVGIPLNEGGHIAYCGKIEWLKPTLGHTSNVPTSQVDTYAIGGAVAIHRIVFEKIGLLDEKYFLYFEDADFSVRARKAGISISIMQDVMIHHNISSTTKKLGSPLLLRYHYRNALYFNLKNGPGYIKILVWPWSWMIVLKQIFKVMIHSIRLRITLNKVEWVIYHNREQSSAILKGVFDFYYHRMGKI